MSDNLSDYFDSADELAAYEAFCAEQERGMEPFNLDAPALICRWRMAGKRVPLLNRHIRALSQRTVNGAPLSHNMLSWVKQHIEWSLAEGDFSIRGGVLMLVIDVNGNAAMTVGEYEPLADVSRAALLARAEEAAREAASTGVAPEVPCCVEGDVLTCFVEEGVPVCGAMTLVEQLAATRGLACARGPLAMAEVAQGSLFLVSDEHGVVPADGVEDEFVALCRQGYERVCALAR